MNALSRRQGLLLGMGVAAFAATGFAAPAHAKNNAEDLIKAFTGGKAVEKGKVKLDVPEIAENGNTVPMTVSVESPMTAEAYVEKVLVVADGNPNAGLATFSFAPGGVAEANTRVRLAETQNVIAVAKMSDGKFYQEQKQVKVTIGGCGG